MSYYGSARSQLQLPEFEPSPEPRPAPTRPQLRALQYLRSGSKLIYRSWPSLGVEIEPFTREGWFLIHPSTARILVAYGWVELKTFDGKRGEYHISKTGIPLTDTLCNHNHPTNGRVKFLPGRAVCSDCWGVLRCVSRRTAPHVATKWHWRYGPVCDSHP